MKKVLIVSDLDGTLLNGKNQISSINSKAINDFQRRGGLFTIATGRMEQSVSRFAKELKLDTPMILYNGAKLVCPRTDKVLCHHELKVERYVWDKLYQLNKEQFGILIYKDGKGFTLYKNDIIKGYEEKEKVFVENLRVSPFASDKVTKFLIIADPEKLKELEYFLIKSRFYCNLVYSEPDYLEILPADVSKGNTLYSLKKILEKELDASIYCIGVGDHLNDLSLISAADYGIAVENAHPKLKGIADEITAHHEEHAIAKIINSLIENRLIV